MQNVAAAQALQSHQHSPATTGSNTADDAVYGATKFSDMSPAEFRSTRLTFKQHAERTQLPVANVSRSSLGVDALPAEVDWRVRGAVTAVKVGKRFKRVGRSNAGHLTHCVRIKGIAAAAGPFQQPVTLRGRGLC